MITRIDEICSNKEMITEERYLEIIKPLMDLSISRNEKYGSSIEQMGDKSIVELIMMKLVRTKNMIDVPNPDPKVYDEIGDSINYLVYILRRLKDNGIDIDTEDGTHLT
jgi:hypothetical protein